MSPLTFDREAFLAKFWKMDAALVASGFPATSPWWRTQIERFVRSGNRRWVIRAGRRAGKSTTLARLAVAWSWFGSWHVPPGDEAVIPFVSVSKDEAGARLRSIAAILKALGLDFEQRADDVELTGSCRVRFKTIACTTSSVVGFTSIAVFGDEVARWESRDAAANPAREVIGSLSPTTATQAFGFLALCSSPWATDDFHAELFDQGDTDHQVTSFAPTWIANPTISEAATHALEPDQRTWQREYGAEPGATVSSAIDLADIEASFEDRITVEGGQGFVAIDASSLRGDTFAWISGVIAKDSIVVRHVGGWAGAEQHQVSMASIAEDIARRAKSLGCWRVFGDQREEAALRSLFQQSGVGLQSYAWSEPSKDDAMQLLRRLMRERRVYLPEHAELRRELTSMKARLMPSGRIRYESNGLDYASALITLAHAMVAGDVVLGTQTAPVFHRANVGITDSFRQPENPFDRTYGPGGTHDWNTCKPLSHRHRNRNRFG